MRCLSYVCVRVLDIAYARRMGLPVIDCRSDWCGFLRLAGNDREVQGSTSAALASLRMTVWVGENGRGMMRANPLRPGLPGACAEEDSAGRAACRLAAWASGVARGGVVAAMVWMSQSVRRRCSASRPSGGWRLMRQGNLFVADAGRHQVLEVSAAGIADGGRRDGGAGLWRRWRRWRRRRLLNAPMVGGCGAGWERSTSPTRAISGCESRARRRDPRRLRGTGPAGSGAWEFSGDGGDATCGDRCGRPAGLAVMRRRGC